MGRKILSTRGFSLSFLFLSAFLLAACQAERPPLNLSESPDRQSAADLEDAYRSLNDGFFAKAEKEFRVLLSSAGDEGSDEEDEIAARLGLAKTLQLMGRAAGSEENYRLAIEQAKANYRLPPKEVRRMELDYLSLLLDRGRGKEAEQLARRLLAEQRRDGGDGAPELPDYLEALAKAEVLLGRYPAADLLYREVFEHQDRYGHGNSESRADRLRGAARVWALLGRYHDAREALEEARDLRSKSYGPRHPLVAQVLTELADVYSDLGRFDEALRSHKEALGLWESGLGLSHPNVAISLNNMAAVLSQQGHHWDAIPLQRRALDIAKTNFGENDAQVAGVMNNLARLLERVGKLSEAEELHRKALVIRKQLFDENHPDVAGSLVNLARIGELEGRYGEARSFLRQALEIRSRGLGRDHPRSLETLHLLARLDDLTGQILEALDKQERVVKGLIGQLAAEHPRVASAEASHALFLSRAGRDQEALTVARRAFRSIQSHLLAEPLGQSSFGEDEGNNFRTDLEALLQVYGEFADREDGLDRTLFSESLEIAQFVQAGSVDRAVTKMAARLSVDDAALASRIRQQQDLQNRWRATDQALLTELGKPLAERDTAQANKLKSTLVMLEVQASDLSESLAREFPDYAQLASFRPLSLEGVQSALRPDEALLVYVLSEQEGYLWAIRPDAHRMVTLAGLARSPVEQQVRRLRQTVDPNLAQVRSLADIPPYDLSTAHRLYEAALLPIEDFLSTAEELFIAVDGPLQSLPFDLLVTRKPTQSARGFQAYGEAAWLTKRYASVVLPSASSLVSLRRVARPSDATQAFLGFGDPKFQGDTADARGAPSYGAVYRGGEADLEGIRALPALPETAGELQTMSKILKGDGKGIYLGEAASEATVKSLDLTRARVLAFATHGLLAGEGGLSLEPTLVLSPPDESSGQDDGLLTASEIAELRMDADLVILSACNTAGGDGQPGAPGLSGLAKAFLFAGARSLMVSHWPVLSEATVLLTTTTLREMAARPEEGRARALQRARLKLIEEGQQPHLKHPMFWAPFVLVGESGATG